MSTPRIARMAAVVALAWCATGRLTPHGEPVTVPYPFSRRFLPVR